MPFSTLDGCEPFSTMVPVTLLYNFVMLAIDVLAVVWLRRHRGLWAWLVVMGCAGGTAVAIGGSLAWRFENHFGVMRLWAYGLLLHGPLLLAATAVLWRRQRPRLACGAGLAALALIAIAADATLIEPHWLEVSHWRIASPKIHTPMRLVVLADLQTDSIGPYERQVFRQALAEKPDVILLAGDYLQSSSDRHKTLRRKLNDLLAEIGLSAPLGIFPCAEIAIRPTGRRFSRDCP